MIAHDTTMKIPIFNTIYFNTPAKITSKKIQIKKLNNLDLNEINSKKYPMVKILNLIPNHNSLYETVIVSANVILVDLFLKKEIKFTEIQKKLFKIIKSKEFSKFRYIYPKKVEEIIQLNDYVRLNILKILYKSKNAQKIN